MGMTLACKLVVWLPLSHATDRVIAGVAGRPWDMPGHATWQRVGRRVGLVVRPRVEELVAGAVR